MARLVSRGIIFLCPFALVFAIVGVVDPFNFFAGPNLIDLSYKQEISGKIDYVLWKLLEFKKSRCENILLGDSRMNVFSPEYIGKVAGEHYYNFSYGGASLNEVCKTFWVANDLTKLQKVYIGVGFDQYNRNNERDRVAIALAITRNPVLYLVNRNVIRATWLLMLSNIRGMPSEIEKPSMTIDEFWEYQLSTIAGRYYEEYGYPAEMVRELRCIAEHCRKRGIQLVFVIPPTHVSLQRQIAKHGLGKQLERFRADLTELATVYDFDYPNELTEDRKNFKDPFHPTSSVADAIVNEIWAGSTHYARVFCPKERK